MTATLWLYSQTQGQHSKPWQVPANLSSCPLPRCGHPFLCRTTQQISTDNMQHSSISEICSAIRRFQLDPSPGCCGSASFKPFNTNFILQTYVTHVLSPVMSSNCGEVPFLWCVHALRTATALRHQCLLPELRLHAQSTEQS